VFFSRELHGFLWISMDFYGFIADDGPWPLTLPVLRKWGDIFRTPATFGERM